MWRTGQAWVEQEERKEERGRKRKEKKGRKGKGQTRKTHTTKQSSCVSPGKDHVGCYLSWVGWVGDVSASKPPPLRICVNSGPWKQRLRKHLLAEELTSGRGKANQLGTFILTVTKNTLHSWRGRSNWLFDLPEANFQTDVVTVYSKDEGHAAKHKRTLLTVMGNLMWLSSLGRPTTKQPATTEFSLNELGRRWGGHPLGLGLAGLHSPESYLPPGNQAAWLSHLALPRLFIYKR